MTHNGWTNCETWLMWSHMSNDGHWYNRMHEIANETLDEDSTIGDLASALRDMMSDDIYENVTTDLPIVYDMINYVLEDVNWHEIAKALDDEKKEEYDRMLNERDGTYQIRS